MAALSALGLITAIPSAVAGVNSVIDLVKGAIPSAFGSSTLSITPQQQAALSGGFGGPITSTGTSVGPTANPVFGASTSANLGGVVPSIVRQLPRILPAIGGAVAGGAAGQVGSSMLLGPSPAPRTMTQKQFILATARQFQPGATSKKIIRSARQCGIELAAATFGLDVLQVCFLISQPPTRRARGISAADLRRTRATVRKVHNIEADFREWCKPRAVRQRK